MRDDGSTAARARWPASSSSSPTRTPSPRSRAASTERRSVTTAGSDTLEHPIRAHALDVLADLQRRADRGLERSFLAPEREQGLGPRDGLPHARQLVEVAVAKEGDRIAHATSN